MYPTWGTLLLALVNYIWCTSNYQFYIPKPSDYTADLLFLRVHDMACSSTGIMVGFGITLISRSCQKMTSGEGGVNYFIITWVTQFHRLCGCFSRLLSGNCQIDCNNVAGTKLLEVNNVDKGYSFLYFHVEFRSPLHGKRMFIQLSR